VLGKTPLSWATTRRYLETLRALLRGDVVEIDGTRTQMIHHPELAVGRPIDAPLLLSAMGPKGQEIAREIADGIIVVGGGVEGFDWCVQMINGTVLDAGEPLTSARVRAAVGPWYVVAYHGTWQAAGEAVDGLPLGADWRAGIERERPEGERHLAVHEGHVTHVLPRDEVVLDAAGDGITGFGWVGTADEIRARAEAAAATGVTELLYTPSGPDMEGEMRRFAEALR
jgi:5,10-methylenetetrahydromethanopterin reductase